MTDLMVADIGDGMCAGIWTPGGATIQLDCGSQQDELGKLPLTFSRIRPEAIILSHFHTDHYNGLFGVRDYGRFAISDVFFPRLPEFPERVEFARDLFAMALRVFGNRSGSAEADFLNLVTQFSSRRFTYRSLSAGQVFVVADCCFEVLWPPAQLTSDRVLASVRKAIEDFHAAVEHDEELRWIYNSISDRGVLEPYLSDETPEQLERGESKEPRLGGNRRSTEALQIPAVVEQANQSLRAAANHLSLAFHEDNELLFLGDLDGNELKQVAGLLEQKRRRHFFTIIAPHHGTHWHAALQWLKTEIVVCSIGSRLINKYRPEFKTLANYCYATHLNGDVHIASRYNRENSWTLWAARRPYRAWRRHLL
jgi:Metallo-beta-lactamase superfamily